MLRISRKSKNTSSVRATVFCFFCSMAILSNVKAEDVTLLTARTPWKKQYVFFAPHIVTKAPENAAVPATPAPKEKPAGTEKPEKHSVLDSGWMQPGFDDSGWLKTRGADLTIGDARARQMRDAPQSYFRGTDPFVSGIGLMAMRGKFVVKDPSKIKNLTMNITYRGGIIVYLNGKELARRSLPEGEIEYNTPSEVYPIEAFCISEGGTLEKLHWFKHREKQFNKYWAMRERNSGSIDIDTKKLVEGVNVIAMEMHRSEYPAECKSKKVGLGFATIGLAEFSLKADTPVDNVISASVRPASFQVWNAPAWEAVGGRSFGNPAEEVRAVRISAARNGVFSGQVVAGAAKDIENLGVQKNKLIGPGAEIEADNIRIRYGAFNPSYGRGRFDLLLDTPPAMVKSKNGAVVPVWVFVKVPADAKAGLYEGSIVISAKDVEPVTVPVEINVSDWSLPDLEDFTPPIFIYQSPESLAKFYKVKMWSEEHWQLIDKSLQLMGEFGNGGLIFPLMAETCMGNPEGMVTWLKQKDGSYKHDFSVFDRYLKTAMKYHLVKRIKVVGINVWGNEVRYRKDGTPSPRGQITIRNEAGEKSNMKLPVYGTPEADEIFRPVLLTIKEKLKAYNIEDKMMYGVGNDGSPAPKQVAMFNQILPGTPWFRESHFDSRGFRYDPSDKNKRVPVGCNSIVWGGEIPDPKKKRLYGWRYDPNHLILNFNRAGTACLTLKGFPPPWSFRMWMESTITCGRNGNGRVGGDFFQMGIDLRAKWKGRRVSSEAIGGSGGTLFGCYPASSVGQTGLGNSTTDLLGPGKNGPVTTIRFENARSGNMEAEARISIEKALLKKTLPADLAKRCQGHLDKRTNALRMWAMNGGKIPLGSFNWQMSNQKLFDLAGEVAKAIEK